MSRLAADRTAGLLPFLVMPEYSAGTCELFGPDPLIAPHLAVVLDDDAARARAIARETVCFFFGLPAYCANLRHLGFTDTDLAGGRSDRLIDAVVAHGSLDQIATRIGEHLAAGADHVARHVPRPPTTCPASSNARE